jgi:hypothetical protein
MSRWTKRSLLKGVFFAVFTLLVLNPNLKRAVMQVQHWWAPESLIRTDFEGMKEINLKINGLWEEYPDKSEPELIEAFIYENIKYVSDYANWGNIEYWPTAEEVWDRGQEDCDGRAVLAVSILRARGFSSAKLVVGLNHMWAQVNANEKNLAQAERITALLHPEGETQVALTGSAGLGQYSRMIAAFLHPAALRKNGAALIFEIPPVRQAILIFAVLFLAQFPGRNPVQLGVVSSVGLLPAMLLSGIVANDHHVPLILGWGISGGLIFYATSEWWFHGWRPKELEAVPQPVAVAGKTGLPNPIRYGDQGC